MKEIEYGMMQEHVNAPYTDSNRPDNRILKSSNQASDGIRSPESKS